MSPLQRQRFRPLRALVAATAVVLGLSLSACSRSETAYPAATPDEAIDSAQMMVANGDADRLVELIHAESPDMRSFLNQFGELLGALQGLGEAVEARFPEELRGFREEAEKAAAEGRTSPFFSRLVAAGRAGSSNRSFGTSQINREGLTIDTGAAPAARRGGPNFLQGPQNESQRRLINDLIKQLLADPYRFLADGRQRLDTVYIADDTVSLTWDDKPLLPPFGLIMVERDGVWRLVPPTSYPGVNRAMPRNADEWFVWGSMLKTIVHVVEDLEREVRGGGVRNLTDLADTAVEKAAIPAMLIVFAYTNLVEEREREAEKAAEAAAAARPPADEAVEQSAAAPDVGEKPADEVPGP